MSTDVVKVPVSLIDDGLLWLINRVVFHPRGFALAYNPDAGTFMLWGNGDEPWSFAPDGDDKFIAAEAVMKRATR